ncbi:GtrA family protein [Alteromonadaceae bacterium M269]|nr:GtrA family protein [Alteromonadaceae bacterium M269]
MGQLLKDTTLILIKFIGVGVLVTLIHVGIYSLLTTTGTTSPQWSNIIAFFFSFTASYLGQKNVTFAQSVVTNEKVALLKFSISTAISFLLNVFWIHLTSEILAIDPNFAIIGMVVFTPAITFMTLKMWVFR